MTLRQILCSSFLISATACALADDWPQWRGPNRDDVSKETGLLQDWPAAGPKLAWKASGLGSGYSSVSVTQGKIFTAGEVDESSFIYALDLNGKKIWTAKLGTPGDPGQKGPGPRSTPSVDGDTVVNLGQMGDLVCLDSASGKERWRKNLKRDLGGSQMSGWGYSESPLIDGDKVIATPGGSGGTVVALSRKSGEVLWQTKDLTDRAGYSSVVPATIAGVRQYVQVTDANFVGLDPATGKILWKGARRGQTAVIPTPIVSGDYVYEATGYGVGCSLFKITKEGSDFKADQVYANKTMINHHGGVVLVGENLYGFSDSGRPGVWVCQNFKSGEMVWSSNKLGKGSIVYADGRLILRQENGPGTIVLIEASPSGYKEHGRFDPPDRSNLNSWAHPVVANGILYLRDQDNLLAYDIKAK